MGKFLLNIAVLLLLSGCSSRQSGKENATPENNTTTQSTQYAGKFSIHNMHDLALLNVYAPWQNAADTRFSYLLGRNRLLVPDSLANLPFIKTPVENCVIMSTTFIGFLDTLDVTHTIMGVSGGRYIFDEEVMQRYRSGNIREVGHDEQLNYEVLLELNPDVVFLFGVQAGIVQTVNKLQEVGIPVVICADYLEPHPLGRAEWIKFFAAFFEKEVLAENIFRDVEHQYDSIAGSVANRAGERKVPEPAQQEAQGDSGKIPEVMLGLPWKDTWYVAGGRSFAAKLISDAGGAYLFRDHDHTEAKPYDIETVFSRAMQADIWLNPGIASSLEQVLEHDRRFRKLDVFRKNAIYSNNKRTGSGGGNDYWESGVIHPDLVLEDLVKIFHDRPLDDNDLYYYQQLK